MSVKPWILVLVCAAIALLDLVIPFGEFWFELAQIIVTIIAVGIAALEE